LFRVGSIPCNLVACFTDVLVGFVEDMEDGSEFEESESEDEVDTLKVRAALELRQDCIFQLWVGPCVFFLRR